MIDYQKVFQLRPEMDAALIISPKNRLYFTGFQSTFGYLVIERTALTFFTDFRYAEMAEDLQKKGVFVQFARSEEVLPMVERFCAQRGLQRLGIEETELTLMQFASLKKSLPNHEFVNVGSAISKMRQTKTEEEIEKIAQAQHITDEAFRAILKVLKPGVKERDIAVELEYQMRKNGADGLAFETIIASGINGSKPHAHPTQKAIANGDAVTMDFGARFEGYCADMTRTVFVGKPSDPMKKIYETVLQAQQNALKNMRAGMTGRQIDSLARELIASYGYADKFTHNLGHSLGIDIHEDPRFAPFWTEEIAENTVMSVEPGIYVPGLGGVRIEDIVVLKADGIYNLTNSEKGIIIL